MDSPASARPRGCKITKMKTDTRTSPLLGLATASHPCKTLTHASMSDNEAGPAGGAAGGGASADDLSLPKATIAKLVTGESTHTLARVRLARSVSGGERRRRNCGTGAHLSDPSPVTPLTRLVRSYPLPAPAARTSEYLSNDLTAGKDVKEFLGDCCKGEAARSLPDSWRLCSLTLVLNHRLRATLA